MVLQCNAGEEAAVFHEALFCNSGTGLFRAQWLPVLLPSGMQCVGRSNGFTINIAANFCLFQE